MSNTLCDLDWVKVEYEPAVAGSRPASSRFRIIVTTPEDDPHTLMVNEPDGDQFAAELDVLASIIRAKVMRARLKGWAAVVNAPQA